MFELEKRNFIVTGGGQGIGLAATRAIAKRGGNVAVWDIREYPEPEFETLSEKSGAKTAYFQTDVGEEDSLTSNFEKAVKFLGSVDGYFTSAGIAIDKPFLEYTWEETMKIQQVTGTFFAAQLAAKQMKKQGRGGSIVLVASIASHFALPGYRMAAYNASKGGFIDSARTRVIRDLKSAKEFGYMDSAPPLKRIGSQNDLTGAVIYLLSDASSYTTGSNIVITGGLHAGRILS